MLSDRQKQIILALADCDMSILAVSKRCYVNYSVVTYHIRQIKKKIGKDPRCFYDLVELVEMVKGGGNK